MIDHFGILAPFYEVLIPPPDVGQLLDLLQLPVSGGFLDAGGGTGRVSVHLQDMVGKLVISDASLRMLAQARRKNGLYLSQAHAERLPFPDRCFERILVVDALHHFIDQRSALQELVRVLMPGGRIVIEEPDIRYLRVKLMALFEKLILMRSRFCAPGRISQILAGCGLSTRIVENGQFTAWVIGDK